MGDEHKTTRDDRFRAWRKAGFGPGEAWRRADMPDIQPPQHETSDSIADRMARALIILARRNIPTDVQALLVYGDPGLGVAPGALQAALEGDV